MPAWLDRVDALLFDLDGVLTQTAALHAAVWKQLFDDYLAAHATGPASAPFRLPEDYLHFVDGKPCYDGVRSFLGSRGISLPDGVPSDPPGDTTACAVGNRKDLLFGAVLAQQGIQTYAGSIDLVRQARAWGKRTACVSSSRNTRPVLERASILDLFDAIVDGLDTERLHLNGKPAPDAFLEGARQTGVAPARAAVFEDAIAGVAAGRAGAFGLVVGVDRGAGATALRQAGANLVVNDLAELLDGHAV